MRDAQRALWSRCQGEFVGAEFLKVPFILGWHSIRQVQKTHYNRATGFRGELRLPDPAARGFNGYNCDLVSNFN